MTKFYAKDFKFLGEQGLYTYVQCTLIEKKRLFSKGTETKEIVIYQDMDRYLWRVLETGQPLTKSACVDVGNFLFSLKLAKEAEEARKTFFNLQIEEKSVVDHESLHNFFCKMKEHFDAHSNLHFMQYVSLARLSGALKDG